MADAELNVELRLKLAQLQADAKAASDVVEKQFKYKAGPLGQLRDKSAVAAEQAINKELLKRSSLLQGIRNQAKAAGEAFGSAVKNAMGGGEFNKSEAMDELSRHTGLSKSTSAINVAGEAAMQDIKDRDKAEKQAEKDRLKALKEREREAMRAAKEQAQQEAQSNKQSLAGSRLNIAMKMRAARDLAKSEKDATTFKKDMSFLAMPLFNPGSMWATLFSTRQTYSAMNTEHGAAFRNSKLGGMGSAGATALLVGGATAAGLVLKVLTKTVQETIAAYEHARQLYAKSLMSGLGVELTTKRGMLASIMGVSEEDVLKFGGAMSYLNPKIEWASGVLARTTPELTRVAWEFDVLKVNLQAMFSLLASEGATSLTNFIAGLSVLVKLLSDSWITRMGAGAISGIASAAVGAMTGGSGLGQLLAKLGFKGISEIGKLSGAGGNMPAPQQFMKTLPTSAWEKMGLVIGGKGSGVNELLRESNKHLSAISKAVTGGNGAIPRSFGMSPVVANP